MRKELRDKIIAFNIRRAQDAQAKTDVLIILAALNQGQKKQLIKDAQVQAVFARYGIEP